MEARIRQIFSATFDLPVAEIGADATPDTIEAWDSLRHMQLVLGLEEEFGVQFSPEQITAMLSFEAVAKTVAEATAAAGR